jgi:FkbM family methyltransferase
MGFSPNAILDIGAHEGWWARGIRSIFPDPYIHMIDALAEKEEHLLRTARDIGNAGSTISMLSRTDGEATPFFKVLAGSISTGSSKYKENTRFPVEERLLQSRTLDTLAAPLGRRFELIKLDVQGSELDILAGGRQTLAQAEFVMLEISLAPYNAGAPLIREVLQQMEEYGFLLFDLMDETRLGPQAALIQIDGLFARSGSVHIPKPPFM